MEYLEYHSVTWTGKLKRDCSCVMGEMGKALIRILFCPYCCRKCSWLFYSNVFYKTPLETIGFPHECLGVKINRSLLSKIQFLCLALESGKARLCIRLRWVTVDWGLSVFHQNINIKDRQFYLVSVWFNFYFPDSILSWILVILVLSSALRFSPENTENATCFCVC